MQLQNIFHWLYVAGMALGAIYLASLGRNPRGVPRYEYFVATFIPIWSGLAYMSMSLPHDDLEQGKIAVAGQITHFARYLDWIITTPLLLLALSWTAMHFLPKKDWTLIGFLMATQVITQVARNYSQQMARDNFFSHTGSDGSTLCAICHYQF